MMKNNKKIFRIFAIIFANILFCVIMALNMLLKLITWEG